MINQENIQQLLDATVYAQGEKVGSVDQVFLDDDTERPSWVTVSTGLFGTKTSFVPIDDANLQGDRLEVSFDKDTIKDAPRIDVDEHLSPEEERQLYQHYNRSNRYDELRANRGVVAGTDRDVVADHDRVSDRDVLGTRDVDLADEVPGNPGAPAPDTGDNLRHEVPGDVGRPVSETGMADREEVPGNIGAPVPEVGHNEQDEVPGNIGAPVHESDAERSYLRPYPREGYEKH